MGTQRPYVSQRGSEHRDLKARVPIALADRFAEIAEAEYRSVSQEIRRLIEQRVTEADQKEATV